MFTLKAFGILLSEGRSVLSPAQRGTGNERFNAKILNLNQYEFRETRYSKQSSFCDFLVSKNKFFLHREEILKNCNNTKFAASF